MLNTWEAAVKFLVPKKHQKTTLDIARFLGWTDRKRLSPARHDGLDAHSGPLAGFGWFRHPEGPPTPDASPEPSMRLEKQKLL
jgi:hypothetical protein